jgi:alpha-L-arabinofuranosidase
MFHVIPREKVAEKSVNPGEEEEVDVKLCTKIAELIRETSVTAEEVARLAEDFDKEAAVTTAFTLPMPSVNEAHKALSAHKGVDNEKKRVLNVRRSIILADLMTNDPIIRDADPNTVAEAYKTMVMTSPRVSLDKAQVVEVSLPTSAAANIQGDLLTSADVRDFNDFEHPQRVQPVSFASSKPGKEVSVATADKRQPLKITPVKGSQGKLRIQLPAKSIVVFTVK